MKMCSYLDEEGRLESNGIDLSDDLNPDMNQFSGSSYRVINFIVDFPVRIDHIIQLDPQGLLGKVVFVMVEFQILDQETTRDNEEGDNSHILYKERHVDRVRSRLRKGGRRWRKDR
jgi:uncharacterized protein (TIGR04552 family)